MATLTKYTNATKRKELQGMKPNEFYECHNDGTRFTVVRRIQGQNTGDIIITYNNLTNLNNSVFKQ